MRRAKVKVCLLLAGLAGMMASACDGPSAVTGPDEQPIAGSSVLHGAVLAPGIGGASAAPGVSALSGADGWIVSVADTALSSEVDEDGRFVLAGVPEGSVTLRIEGPGVSGQVAVSGLVGGQVTSVEIRISGASAQLTGQPRCAPSAETYFSGRLDQVAGTELVVSGRRVDASQLRKVWRGEARIQLSELSLGEKVKVWGVLRGDAVVLAEEIAALTADGNKTWTTFSGKVDLVESRGFLPNPTPPKPSYPTLYVAGRKLKPDAGTQLKWSDGTPLDAEQIRTGDHAYVEGWSLPEGYVQATRLVIDCR